MNILLTSAGRRGYLVEYFQQALAGKGRVFASNSAYSIALQKADGYFISPLIYDDNYIDSILAYCKENDINAVVSLFDIDLPVLAASRDRLESEGIRLLLASKEAVDICNDKWRTKEFLQENGVMTPVTYKNIATFQEGLDRGEIAFPVVVKPRWGMASMGIYIAEDAQELEVFYNKSLRDIAGSYLKYESSQTPEEQVLIQERLVGVEYGVDVINDLEGNYVATLPKSKLAMRAGETDLGESVSPAPFEAIAKILSGGLKHQVILSVDCFDVDGTIYVTELNCRISGHYPLSHLAGVNLPKQIVEWLEEKPTDMENFKFKEGLLITKDIVPVILDKK